MVSSVSYSSLPSSPDPDGPDTAVTEKKKPGKAIQVGTILAELKANNISKASNLEINLQKWALIGALCSSFISFLLFLRTPNAPHEITSPVDLKEMRRPSSYMGLEKVSQDPSRQPFPSIVSHPQVVLQIQTQDPLRTIQEDEHGYYGKEGGMFPDDRHFVLSSRVCRV